jgi:hypothetical protein
MSKNVVEPERPQVTMWRHVASLISKATRPQAHSRASTPTQTHARTLAHVRTITRARAHTRKGKQTQKYVTFIAFFFTAKVVSLST